MVCKYSRVRHEGFPAGANHVRLPFWAQHNRDTELKADDPLGVSRKVTNPMKMATVREGALKPAVLRRGL